MFPEFSCFTLGVSLFSVIEDEKEEDDDVFYRDTRNQKVPETFYYLDVWQEKNEG